MIQIENLSVVFNSGKPDEVIAVNDISLHIKKGEFVTVIGANGSGKSSLLNAIAGSVGIKAGSIRIDGSDVTSLPEHKRSKWISRVFQNPLTGTAPDLSIIDNLRLAALRTGSKKLKIGIDKDFKETVTNKLKELNLGLENKTQELVGKLSGGQRQALTLLMAVMDQTKVLLMDEPTAALDPKISERILHLASELIRREGLTALLITHNIKDALRFGERIIQMQEGIIIRDIDKRNDNLTPEMIFNWF
jgi:putative tryptophan/tyrosine transport system ATP-binding protein